MNSNTSPPFDWSLLRSFLAALEHGTLLGAAKALNTHQPTLGRHIAELENQLGVVLFERTGRGLLPSAAARALEPHARAVQTHALALAQRARGAHAPAAARVRVSASTPVATYLLPGVLARLRQSHPHIQVEVVASNALSNLLRREADIAVRMLRPAQSSLVARKLGEVGIGAWAQRDYLARFAAVRRMEDFMRLDWIGGDTDTSITQGFAAMGHPVGTDAFALRTDDLVVQVQAARAGLGVGFLAHYTVREDPAMVQLLPQVLKIPPLPMWLAVHREIRTNAHIRTVFDALADGLPRLL
ncbi:MAG: LysR family transcriptional regulator [Rhodoferax sp.]